MRVEVKVGVMSAGQKKKQNMGVAVKRFDKRRNVRVGVELKGMAIGGGRMGSQRRSGGMGKMRRKIGGAAESQRARRGKR